MKINELILFIGKSVILGLVISSLLLVFIPDLRNQSGGQTEKLSFNQAIRRAAPAVVNIYSVSTDLRSSLLLRQQVERTSLGSGVIMNEEGYLLTCYHVIQRADSIIVGLQDGQRSEAQLVGYDVITDLAVLKIDATNLPVIPKLEDPDHQVGDLVLAIGNPYDLGQTITQGIISRTGRNGLSNYADYIQMDAILNEGNSGGALVDSNGNLLGINNAKFKTLDRNRRVKDVEGVSFAVPYALAKRVMEEVIANGKVTRGQLGFSGNELVGHNGILVTSVAANSPAYRAGLQPEDILVAINGEAVKSSATTLDLIAETSPGTTLKLQVSRREQLFDLEAVVTELVTQ